MWQWIHSSSIHLHQLLQADAFDDSVIINLIDSETVGLLTYYFQSTETAREHPIIHHWTVDGDAATIIQALEGLHWEINYRNIIGSDKIIRWLFSV